MWHETQMFSLTRTKKGYPRVFDGQINAELRFLQGFSPVKEQLLFFDVVLYKVNSSEL